MNIRDRIPPCLKDLIDGKPLRRVDPTCSCRTFPGAQVIGDLLRGDMAELARRGAQRLPEDNKQKLRAICPQPNQ